MKVHNQTPFPFGAKSCLRKPGAPEMTAVVRAKLTLTPRPEPVKSAAIDEASLEALRQENAAEAEKVVRALTVLGQGALSADRFHDDDHRREGEVLYPSDFA